MLENQLVAHRERLGLAGGAAGQDLDARRAAVVLHAEDLHDALRTMLHEQHIGVVVLDGLRARWEGPEAVRAQGAPQTPRIEILTSGAGWSSRCR